MRQRVMPRPPHGTHLQSHRVDQHFTSVHKQGSDPACRHFIFDFQKEQPRITSDRACTFRASGGFEFDAATEPGTLVRRRSIVSHVVHVKTRISNRHRTLCTAKSDARTGLDWMRTVMTRRPMSSMLLYIGTPHNCTAASGVTRANQNSAQGWATCKLCQMSQQVLS